MRAAIWHLFATFFVVPPLQPACCYWHKGLHTYHPKVDTQKHPQHSRNKLWMDNYENTGRRYVGSQQIQTQPQTSSEQVMIERDYFCIILFFFFQTWSRKQPEHFDQKFLETSCWHKAAVDLCCRQVPDHSKLKQCEQESLTRLECGKKQDFAAAGVSLCVFLLCVPAVFPVWRGIRASSGVGGGWSQGWARCLRWEPDSPGQRPRIPVFDYPVWLVLCRGGRARLIEVCQRGRGAIRLPEDMLSIKLPELFDIHQVPKVRSQTSFIRYLIDLSCCLF